MFACEQLTWEYILIARIFKWNCTECGEKLNLKNERTEKQSDGSIHTFVDGWCVNESCSRKNVLDVIDTTRSRIKYEPDTDEFI
jgi:hypothetical protein